MSGKISQYTEALSVANDDFFDVSIDTGGGVYATRKVRKSNLGIGGGGNFADSDLTFTGDRSHDLGNNQLLIDGDTSGGTSTSFRFNTNGEVLGNKSYFEIGDLGEITMRSTNSSWAFRMYEDRSSNITFSVGSRGAGDWNSYSGAKINIGHPNNNFYFKVATFSTEWEYLGQKVHNVDPRNNTPVTFHRQGWSSIDSFVIGSTARIGTERISLQGETLVRGLGSTSATTSLLVENNSGTDLLDIKDDGTGIINATGRVIRLFKSTAFNPYMEINSSAGNNCSLVFSQGATSKYSIGFDNFTGDFRVFDIGAGVNRLAVTSAGKINLFSPSTTTKDFNVKGSGLFEINNNNPLTVRTTNNANMFLAIDSASTLYNSQIQFQQGTSAKWNIGCLGNTQSFWFYNHATTNTPLEIDSSDNIIMANLPTSSAGLPSGALWNNSGVVNIV